MTYRRGPISVKALLLMIEIVHGAKFIQSLPSDNQEKGLLVIYGILGTVCKYIKYEGAL